MIKVLFLSSLIFLFAACGGGESSNSLSDDIEEVTSSIPSSEREPCDYIDEAMVRSVFGVGDAVEITANNSYGICSFQWDSLTETERAAADEEMASAMISAVMSGKVLDKGAMQKGHYNISLNFTTYKIEDVADAVRAYEGINKQMSEGITVSADQVKEKTSSISDEAIEDAIGDGVTFKGGERTDINGVGDKAVWDSKLNQLTVLSGTDIFFMTVEASGDKELSIEKAKEMAEQVIDKL